MLKIIISGPKSLLIHPVRSQEGARSLLYLRSVWRPAWETANTILCVPSGKLSLLNLIPPESFADINELTLLKPIHRIVGVVAEIERGDVIHSSPLIARNLK